MPRIEYFVFYRYVLSFSFFALENKVRLKDRKAIKNFIRNFYGVGSQVSPTDSDCALMKIVKSFPQRSDTETLH